MKATIIYLCCLITLASCSSDELPEESCPGYVKVCSAKSMDSDRECWYEWRECPGPYVPQFYLTFNSISAQNFLLKAGDTVQVEIRYSPFEFDSVIFKICGDVFFRRILIDQVAERPGTSSYEGIALREEIILNRNLTPGNYQYLIEAWADKKVVTKTIKDVIIYPPFNISSACIEGEKKSLVIYPPSNTASNAKMEIREVTNKEDNRWIHEEDSVFTLTKFYEFYYCIAIDFRTVEYFYLFIDGVCIKTRSDDNCQEFVNDPALVIYNVDERRGTFPKQYVCKFE